jgi:hypothetical protein
MTKMAPIPSGAIFYISAGCYSDYRVEGVFRALVEIDAEKLRKEWLSKHPEQKTEYKFDGDDFIAAHSHLMEQVDSWEWYLTAYGNAGEMDTIHA